MKVTVLGAGSFGTSIGQILCDNGHDVLFWNVEEDVNTDISINKMNTKYGFNSVIGQNVNATSDLKIAVEHSDVIFNVLPTAFVRSTFEKISEVINLPKIFVNASKGIEPDTLCFIGDIIENTIQEENIVGFIDISGPSHAELLAKRELTALSVASTNIKLAEFISKLIKNSYIKTATTTDVIALEYISSAKNVIALGAGVFKGLGHGENIISAFIAMGLNEILYVGKMMSASRETILSFGGLGDLIVTATSENSRNVQFGKLIGEGQNLEEAKSHMSQIAEGVRSLQSMYESGKKYHIDLVIVNTLYDIIYNGADPKKIVSVFD